MGLWEKEQQRKAQKKVEQSPIGRARATREAGQLFFQTLIPIEALDRSVLSHLGSHVADTGDVVGAVLTAIEAEGWELVHAGFAYRPAAVAQGNTVGIYLFRARD